MRPRGCGVHPRGGKGVPLVPVAGGPWEVCSGGGTEPRMRGKKNATGTSCGTSVFLKVQGFLCRKQMLR